jgi:hypothetical protein
MIRAARSRALGRVARRHGWRERFLTMTLPHSGDVERDVRALPLAWLTFRKALWEFFRYEHGLDSDLLARVAFMRVLEVTPGRIADGHAHLHVYLFLPYVPHELARHLWGTALRKHGYEPPTRALEDVLAGREGRRRNQLERVLVTRRGNRGKPLTLVD